MKSQDTDTIKIDEDIKDKAIVKSRIELNLNLELASLCFTEEVKYIHFGLKIVLGRSWGRNSVKRDL